MNYQHKTLAAGRWSDFSFAEQMANVGSEVGRVINWKAKGKQTYANSAFDRALELLDLTIADKRNCSSRLRELCRVRETLVDFIVFDNIYESTAQQWKKYFLAFNYAARLAKSPS